MAAPEVVRTRTQPSRRTRRGLDDSLAVRAPALNRLSAAVLRPPVGSRVRSAMVSRALANALAAGSRLDYERLFAGCAPDYEIHPGWAAVDLEPAYHGTSGLRPLVEGLRSGFGEVRWEPRGLLDAGGCRFAVRLDFVGDRKAAVVVVELSERD